MEWWWTWHCACGCIGRQWSVLGGSTTGRGQMLMPGQAAVPTVPMNVWTHILGVLILAIGCTHSHCAHSCHCLCAHSRRLFMKADCGFGCRVRSSTLVGRGRGLSGRPQYRCAPYYSWSTSSAPSSSCSSAPPYMCSSAPFSSYSSAPPYSPIAVAPAVHHPLATAVQHPLAAAVHHPLQQGPTIAVVPAVLLYQS